MTASENAKEFREERPAGVRPGRRMKTIRTGGISFIEPVPEAAGEWYFGLDDGHMDLYEAEELFRGGQAVRGRALCLVHYPDGQVFFPVPKAEGHCCERNVIKINTLREGQRGLTIRK